MKTTLCINIFFLISYFGICQNSVIKSIHIPLDNKKGIAYQNLETGIMINGFDINDEEIFYFYGGTIPTLSTVSKGKVISRHQYRDFYDGDLYLTTNYISVFDMKYDFKKKKTSNAIYRLNLSDGTITDKFKFISDGSINSYHFVDSSLILQFLEVKKGPSSYKYLKYSMSGKFIKEAPNAYDLPIQLYPQSYIDKNVIYLGKWQGKYLYYGIETLNQDKVWLLDKLGKQVSEIKFNNKNFGKMFAERPSELIKLRNGAIYVSGYDKKDLIITKIDLQTLFK